MANAAHPALILETRKTAPGLRLVDKWAVETHSLTKSLLVFFFFFLFLCLIVANILKESPISGINWWREESQNGFI